jgi:hypothetical protein
MKLYLHTCCAVCLAGLVERLRAEGSAFTAFFYNPNVHPLIEFRRRLKATQVLCERESIPLEMVKDYGLVDWLRAAAGRESVPERCEICYADRLGETARRAHRGGSRADARRPVPRRRLARHARRRKSPREKDEPLSTAILRVCILRV